MRFDSNDTNTVIHALRVAAQTFYNDAKIASELNPPNPRLAGQFKQQAEDSERIADALENAEGDSTFAQCW